MTVVNLTLNYQDGKEIKAPFVILKQNTTEEEFWTFANEDIDCELLDEVLVIHSPAIDEHEDIFSYLMTIFRAYLDASGQGKVRGSRFVMRLTQKWSPEPDLLVITPESYENLREGYLDGPADITIEILSDSTREIDLEKKLPQYLEAGVKEAWIIDPKEKTIQIHFQDEIDAYPESSSDQVILSKVLPGLKIKVKWIWNRENFPSHQVLQELLP